MVSFIKKGLEKYGEIKKVYFCSISNDEYGIHINWMWRDKAK